MSSLDKFSNGFKNAEFDLKTAFACRACFGIPSIFLN